MYLKVLNGAMNHKNESSGRLLKFIYKEFELEYVCMIEEKKRNNNTYFGSGRGSGSFRPNPAGCSMALCSFKIINSASTFPLKN